MDPVSNTDRLIAILRRKLQERAKANSGGSAIAESQGGEQTSSLRALAATEGMNGRPIRRALVQSVLADQLGSSLINDARFQQIVTRVTDALEDDPSTSRLLSSLVDQLRP